MSTRIWHRKVGNKSCRGTTSAYHTCCAPDVCWRAVDGTNQDFQGPILAGLNVLCKMFMLRTGNKVKIHLRTVCVPHLTQYNPLERANRNVSPTMPPYVCFIHQSRAISTSQPQAYGVVFPPSCIWSNSWAATERLCTDFWWGKI